MEYRCAENYKNPILTLIYCICIIRVNTTEKNHTNIKKEESL